MLDSDLGTSATPLIDMVINGKPDPGDRAMAIYLQGRVQQQLGELDRALTLWAQAAATNDRKSRARALYATAMALYEAKRVSRPETIKTLDALRFSWRGDNFEFTLLRRLGEMKLAENDIEGGLDTLHLASSYFSDYPAAQDVSKEASDAFADLFIGKTADDVPPVKALAVYDAFPDLIPAGDIHDAIVKKLVDRLVAVDLLDRAAGLLTDQVKNHLTGLDKARAATQVALLRLMNNQPDATIAALDIDVGTGIPPDLVRQRQELRARGLLDLNRAPEALSMLANDTSRDAYRLRADIYWRQRDWKNAAKTFAQLVGDPSAQGTLDPETARIVMSWAAALTLDGDQQGIAKLRGDFGAAMAQTDSATAFNIIAGDANAAAAGGGTPNEIAARVAQIDTLQNFMSAYKKRLATDKLSAIN
jgi:tetratricopeptide (TPR) repeat protein